MANDVDFENLVTRHYGPLYQFAFSLTRDEAEACDLTQQTFCIWAAKGHQLRDVTKVKTWLFTTLHREFLGSRRRQTRFPHVELEYAAAELPVVHESLGVPVVKSDKGNGTTMVLSPKLLLITRSPVLYPSLPTIVF